MISRHVPLGDLLKEAAQHLQLIHPEVENLHRKTKNQKWLRILEEAHTGTYKQTFIYYDKATVSGDFVRRVLQASCQINKHHYCDTITCHTTENEGYVAPNNCITDLTKGKGELAKKGYLGVRIVALVGHGHTCTAT